MIPRQWELKTIQKLLKNNPVVAIIGARQVGKTTLARLVAKDYPSAVHYFDLEDPTDLARLADPMLALRDLEGLIVIDEIQRHPDLFPVLRVLVDKPGGNFHFLILGSASPHLLRQSSESLAGRIAYHQLDGFAIDEVGISNYQRLWLRGGFPRSYLANSEASSFRWRQEFIKTFLERDLPQLGVRLPPITLSRFWQMLAHYHGQVWNASEIARSFGVADTTVRRYLDLLTGALVVRQLLPWFENISKRQVKAPKIYLSDSGLLHALLNLRSWNDLLGHPKKGASWEGFIINQIKRQLNVSWEECYFWATHAGAELDLLVVRGQRKIGFEIKLTTAPKVTHSMRTAIQDLGLEKLYVVFPGEHSFPMADKIVAIPLSKISQELKAM